MQFHTCSIFIILMIILSKQVFLLVTFCILHIKRLRKHIFPLTKWVIKLFSLIVTIYYLNRYLLWLLFKNWFQSRCIHFFNITMFWFHKILVFLLFRRQIMLSLPSFLLFGRYLNWCLQVIHFVFILAFRSITFSCEWIIMISTLIKASAVIELFVGSLLFFVG